MSNLRKPIKVRLLKEAEEYFFAQSEKVQVKFHLAFDKVEAGHKGKWFEKLKGTDGLYEFRQSDHQKFYRVFAFWDSEERNTLIIGTHGFDKKSNKTPRKEIRKAEQIKRKYFETKISIK
ncbi:MAG: type II toxin-antitoxin system RelE/ParE family toxin [Bacteroidetes bacterium]|nr:MAG: type II toxin-antitoxin system RelE/ParE family toxin [Bacteroidota bacterium]